jgi:hypothetical protein
VLGIVGGSCATLFGCWCCRERGILCGGSDHDSQFGLVQTGSKNDDQQRLFGGSEVHADSAARPGSAGSPVAPSMATPIMPSGGRHSPGDSQTVNGTRVGVSRAFPYFTWSILAEIYLRHAFSYHE